MAAGSEREVSVYDPARPEPLESARRFRAAAVDFPGDSELTDHPAVASRPEGFLQHDRSDPEPTRHVPELGIVPGFTRRQERLEGHTADAAIAGGILANLRIHRAGVDRAGQSPDPVSPEVGRAHADGVGVAAVYANAESTLHHLSAVCGRISWSP